MTNGGTDTKDTEKNPSTRSSTLPGRAAANTPSGTPSAIARARLVSASTTVLEQGVAHEIPAPGCR